MKKFIIYSIALIILFLSTGSISAQVTFRMKRAPLNQLRSADLWNATIINTGEAFTAYIYGSLTNNENSELIATGQTMTFTVKKGTTNFKISDLPKIPDVSYLSKDPKYKKSFMNTGGAPPGDYKICCELRRTDNTVAGEDCFDQKIIGSDPPQLISPRDEEELRIDNPVFTWMHVKAPNSSISYSIKIVELKDNQSPDEAIKRNQAFFEKEGLSQQLFQYPSTASKFEAGKKYAWIVKVGDLQSENLRDLQSTVGIFIRGGLKTPLVTDSLHTTTSTPCIDFENTIVHNFVSYFVSSIDIINNAPDPINSTHVLKLVDGSSSVGASVAINSIDYSGNWLEKGQDGCLCFDYKIDWNENAATTAGTVPKVLIYTGPVITTYTQYVNCTRAYFIGNPLNPLLQDNVWGHYCLPIGLSQNNVLPSNNLGQWAIYQNAVLLTGSAASTAWDNLIQNVTGLVLVTDYNGDPSEIVYFDNFCWTCTPTVPPGNVCDSLKVVAVHNAIGDCCWSLNLTHPSSTANITGIQFLALSPNTFVTGSSSLGSSYTGWIFPVNSPQEFKIQKLSGSIPPGQLNGFFNFCMNKLSSPQHVVVNWIKNDNSIACSDTVTLNCDIPCVTFSKDTLLCNGNSYNLHYSITNNSTFPISKIEVENTVPSGIIISPAIFTLSPSVTSGQTTNQPAFTVNGAKPDSTVCVVFKFTSPDGCCWCYDTLCLKIPSCVCNEVSADVVGDPTNCCYNLNLHNNYSGNYFTQVNLMTLETGVTFSTWNTNTANNWYSTNTYPANTVNLINYPNNYIPTGNLTNVINFCLTNYTSTTQHILVEWVGKDSVKCVDTLVTHCVPPPPPTSCIQLLNDSLVCQPDGTFKYTFYVKNNSSHTTTGFQFNAISPSSLNFNPANFSNVTIGPGMQSSQQTLIISGVTQGSQFCFNLSLYEHVLINGNQYYDWCCYSDTICKTMPSCHSGGCLQSVIDSLYCINDSSGVKKYGYTMRLANLTSTSGNYELFNSCGTFIGNNTGTIPANSIIQINGQFSTTHVGSCCIIIKFYIYTPVGTDTCVNEKCFTLPNCDSVVVHHDTCNCGKWKSESILAVKPNPGALSDSMELKCGDVIFVEGIQHMNFTFPDYICNQTSPSCNVTYNWTITGPIPQSGNMTANVINNVNLTAPGPYVITMYASCGGHKCDSCKINFDFKNDSCNCGQWLEPWPERSEEIKITSGNTSYYVDCNYNVQTPVGPLPAGNQIKFEASYQCSPYKCPPVYDWYLINTSNSQTISSGTNATMPIYFTPPSNIATKYQFVVIPKCGVKNCDSCGFYFTTDDKTDCDCGKEKWNPHSGINYYDAAGRESKTKLGCFDETFYGPMLAGSNVTYTVSPYLCIKPDCITNYKWNIIDLGSGSIVNSGTTTTLPVTYTAPPESKYKFIIYAYCGDRACDSCGFNFSTVGKSDCDCGDKWFAPGRIDYYNTAGKESKKVGCFDENFYGPMSAGTNITYTTSPYLCSKPDCTTNYKWNIIDLGTGSIVNSSTTTTLPFTFTSPQEGKYKFIIYADCGGKICDSCGFNFSTVGKTDCDCGDKWFAPSRIDYYNTARKESKKVGCFDETFYGPMSAGSNITYTTSPYLCSKPDCITNYKWNIIDLGSGSIVNSGTTTILPVTFTSPQEGKYKFIIYADCGGKTCDSCGFNFSTVGKTDCDCGKWASNEIQVSINDRPQHPVSCTAKVPVNLNSQLTLTFPSYICGTENCTATYSWDLTGGSGLIPIHITGTGNPFNYMFNTPGSYILSFKALCGGKVCDSCWVIINVIQTDCKCGDKWSPHSNIGYINPDGKENKLKIGCFEKVIYGPMAVGSDINYNANPYVCSTSGCTTNYKWNLIDLGSGSIVNSGTTTTMPVTFTAPPESKYRFTIYAYCGDEACDSCGFIFNTVGKSDCDCGGWAEDNKGFTIHGFNGDPNHEIETFLPCGKEYGGVILGTSWDLVSQTYKCVGKLSNCNASYNWTITSQTGILTSFNTQVINSFVFNELGTYSINLKVSCNGKVCDSCMTYINVIKPPNPTGCNCGINTYGGQISFDGYKINCGQNLTDTVFSTGNHTVIGPVFICSDSSTCHPVYNYTLIRNGITIWTSSNGYHQFSANFTKDAGSNSTYNIIFSVSCGGIECGTCSTSVIIGTGNLCDSSSNTHLYDASSFMNTLTSSQLIDFSTNDDGSPISTSGTPVPLSGWTRNGLTFSGCTSYWNQFIAGSAGQYITIVLPTGMYKKAGFDMSLYYPMVGDYTIKVTSGNCVYTYVQPGAASQSPYFGINLQTAIDKIEVMHTTGSLIIDNFRFGN